MPTLREVRQSIPLTAAELWFETKQDRREVSFATIYKAENSVPISRFKAESIIHTLNRLTGGTYTRESFPELRILEEQNVSEVEEEPDRAIA